MPDILDVQIPPGQLAKLEEKLSPKQYRQATFQIVKRTTAQVVKLIRKQVQSQVAINKKYVDRVITQYKPQGDPPVGRVVVKKAMIPLVAFRFRALKRGGVSVQIGKDKPPLILRHAFVATMKNIDPNTLGTVTHQGIFLRSRHAPTKGPNAFLKDRQGNPKYKLTPQGFAGRLAIEQQFGPSILKLISVPNVLKQIMFDADAYMAKQAQSQIDRFTKEVPAAAPDAGTE